MNEGEFKFLRQGAEDFPKKTIDNRLTEDNQVKSGREPWGIYDSGLLTGLCSFDWRFKELLPKEYKDIREYIESEMKEKSGSAIGLEIGGPGSKLFSEFSPGFLKESFGTTLTDYRTEKEKEKDIENNHTVFSGDIFTNEGFRDLKKKLGGKKVNVLFERMQGALPVYPQIGYMAGIFDRLYSLLDDEGVMFVQMPIFLRDRVKEDYADAFLEKLKPIPGIEITLNYDSHILLLRKNKNAPASLKEYF